MTRRLWNWDTESFQTVDVEGRMIALAASAAAYAVETDDGVVPETLEEVAGGAEFVIPLLIPEEVESGDGRKMDKDALTTRDLPISLLWQPSTGDGHNGSFIVGRIDTIERVENGLGNARGVFDTGPYGREAQRLVEAKMLRGVSADLDQFEATVDGKEMSGENFEDEVDKITSEKITINRARVMAATLVPKPAFQECTIQLASEGFEEEIAPMVDGVYEEEPLEQDVEFVTSALAASAAPVQPPASWFEDPKLSGPIPLTIDDDGRVYGHIATWQTDHIAYNSGVKPPRSASDYAYFRTGLVRTEEGSDVSVGQLTLAGGHASLEADAHRAVKHYDDTASAVADVSAGEDAFGIWVAGGLRPGVTPEQVRTLRASPPSGDWRPIRNRLELVAICCVNVPGFPIARARVASGSVMALVAAGAQTLHKMRHSEMDELAMRLTSLENQILEQKANELAARMAPLREKRLNELREAANAARAVIAPELDKRAQLAAKADELRAQFKAFTFPPDFKEDAHPRTDDGKFRKILGRLTDTLKDSDVPGGEEARADLEKAADLEDSGDAEGAKNAAGDAAGKLEKAASDAGTPEPGVPGVEGDAPEGDAPADGPKARIGETLKDIANEVGEAISDTAGAAADGVEKAVDTVKKSDDALPPEIQALLDKLVENIGEGVSPQQIISRMDGKLKQWLEGKGFESPEDMAKFIADKMSKPLTPGIAQ